MAEKETKNFGKLLELRTKVTFAALFTNPKAASITAPDKINYHQNGKRLYLAKVAYINDY